jgi:hypothetical protein
MADRVPRVFVLQVRLSALGASPRALFVEVEGNTCSGRLDRIPTDLLPPRRSNVISSFQLPPNNAAYRTCPF